MSIRRTVAFVAFPVLAVLGAACGSGSVDQQAVAAPTSRPPSTPTAVEASGPRQNEIPDAVVREVADGTEINIRSLAPAAEPILFWFYAPH